MQAARVVEVVFGTASAGSGYLITARHVLTARHVVPESMRTVGAACRIRQLASSVAEKPMGLEPRPAWRSARISWLQPDGDLDLAVLELDGGPVDLEEKEALLFGRVAGNDLTPRPFVCTGFPEAAGDSSRVVQGSATFVPTDLRFDLDQSVGLASDWRRWAGLSGAAVFCNQRLVGVVRTVDGNWLGKLTATPIQRLTENAGFLSYWTTQPHPLPLPRLEDFERVNASMLEKVSAHVYLLDRKTTVKQIIQQIRLIRGNAPSTVFVIEGLDDDEHKHLIRQVSESAQFKQLIGRDATCEQMIVPLPWPVEEQIDASEAFSDLIAPLCRAAFIPTPAEHEEPDVTLLRSRLNQQSVPRAYWTHVRRKIAFGGHTELLQRLFRFWERLGTGAPALLFISFAADDPPPRAASRLRRLFVTEPLHEATLEFAFDNAHTQLKDRCWMFGPLDIIDQDHLESWIAELGQRCLSVRAEQLEALRLLLLARVRNPMRLRRIECELGELLSKSF